MATSIITLLNDGLAAMNYAQTGGVKLDVTKFKVFRSPTAVASLPNVPLVTLKATDLPTTSGATSGGYTLLHSSTDSGGTAPNELDIVSGDTAVIKCNQAAALGDYDYDVVAIYVDAPTGFPGYAEGDEVLLGMYGARSIISKRATGSNDANTIEHLLGIQFSQIAGVININFTNAKRPYNYIREVNDISTIGIANDSTDRIWRVTRKDWTGVEDNGGSTYLVHAAKWVGDSKAFQTHNEWIPSDHTLIFNDYNTGTEDDYEVPYIANHPSDSNFTNTTTRLVIAVPTGHRYVPEPFTGLLVSFFSGTLAGRIYHVLSSAAVEVSSPSVLRYISFTLATTMPEAATPGQRNVKIWAPNLDAVTQSEFNLSQTNQDTAIAAAQSTADTANTRIDELDFTTFLSNSNFGKAFSTIVFDNLGSVEYAGFPTTTSTMHNHSASTVTIPAMAGFKIRITAIGEGGDGGISRIDNSEYGWSSGGGSGEVVVAEVPLTSPLRIKVAALISESSNVTNSPIGHRSPFTSGFYGQGPTGRCSWVGFTGRPTIAEIEYLNGAGTTVQSRQRILALGGIAGTGGVWGTNGASWRDDTTSSNTNSVAGFHLQFYAPYNASRIKSPVDNLELTTFDAAKGYMWTDGLEATSVTTCPLLTDITFALNSYNCGSLDTIYSYGADTQQPQYRSAAKTNPTNLINLGSTSKQFAFYGWSTQATTFDVPDLIAVRTIPRRRGGMGDEYGDGNNPLFFSSMGAGFEDLFRARYNYTEWWQLTTTADQIPSYWWPTTGASAGQAVVESDGFQRDGILGSFFATSVMLSGFDIGIGNGRQGLLLEKTNLASCLGSLSHLNGDGYDQHPWGSYFTSRYYVTGSGGTTNTEVFRCGFPSMPGLKNNGTGVLARVDIGGGGGSVPLDVFNYTPQENWTFVMGGAGNSPMETIASGLHRRGLSAMYSGGKGGLGYGAGGGGAAETKTDVDDFPGSISGGKGAPGAVILTILPLEHKDILTP